MFPNEFLLKSDKQPFLLTSSPFSTSTREKRICEVNKQTFMHKNGGVAGLDVFHPARRMVNNFRFQHSVYSFFCQMAESLHVVPLRIRMLV